MNRTTRGLDRLPSLGPGDREKDPTPPRQRGGRPRFREMWAAALTTFDDDETVSLPEPEILGTSFRRTPEYSRIPRSAGRSTVKTGARSPDRGPE